MEKKEAQDNLFTSLFPSMMKTTRLLMIEPDVTRYHSFDLLRYQLAMDTRTKNKDHFMSIKPEYRFMLDMSNKLADQIHFMQTTVREFNIFDCFNVSLGVTTGEEYEARIHELLKYNLAKITPTDISSRFDVIFDRPGVDGFLLQYKDEPHRASCYNKLTVYESEHIINLDMAVAIIEKHRINAVMISSTELAIRLSSRLIRDGYKDPMTFIIGWYGYNFVKSNDPYHPVRPKFNSEMGTLELNYKYEFGYFDPFSGISQMTAHKDN